MRKYAFDIPDAEEGGFLFTSKLFRTYYKKKPARFHSGWLF